MIPHDCLFVGFGVLTGLAGGFFAASCVYFQSHLSKRTLPIKESSRVGYLTLLGLASAFAFAIALLLTDSSPLIAVVPAILALYVPAWILERKIRLRREQIETQLPACVRGIASATKAGLTITEAIERILKDTPMPLHIELSDIANRARLGASIADSLMEKRRQLNIGGFHLFAAALQVNQSQGGDLPTLLSELAASLELAAQCRRQVRSATAEGRAALKVLMIAFPVLLTMMFAVDFYGTFRVVTTYKGQLILMIAAIPGLVGLFWAKQISSASV